MHAAEQRQPGDIDVLARDPRDGAADDDEDCPEEKELLRSPRDRK
jgi:hypothetical protein